ncbi:MAG TPA: Ig-like domain-containing protein [Polyangia bacterium]
MISSASLRHASAALLLAIATVDCGGSSGPKTGTDAGGVDESPTTEDGAPNNNGDGETDGAGACHAPGYGGGEMAQMIASVSATITDVSGAPVAGMPVSVTGINLSFPGQTAADGTATVSVSANAGLKTPAFRYGDGLTYPRLLVPLTKPMSALPALVTAKNPATGAALTPGTSATSGDLTLTIAAGAAVLIDTLSFDTVDKQALRAVTLPPDRLADVAGGLGFDLVIAAGPAQTTFCPPAAASVPNALGWPAGTKVEFLILGGDVGQSWAPWVGWTKVSDGAVSDDGRTIATAPGGGLPVLDVIGIRQAADTACFIAP